MLCCLACGHLFGERCIRKWIKRSKFCPQCHAKAKPRDIRVLYVPEVVVRENRDERRLERLLEEERADKLAVEKECAEVKVSLDVLQMDHRALKGRMAKLSAHAQATEENARRLRLALAKLRSVPLSDRTNTDRSSVSSNSPLQQRKRQRFAQNQSQNVDAKVRIAEKAHLAHLEKQVDILKSERKAAKRKMDTLTAEYTALFMATSKSGGGA